MLIAGVAAALAAQVAAQAVQPSPSSQAGVAVAPAPATSAQTREAPAPAVGAPSIAVPVAPEAVAGVTPYPPSFFDPFRPVTALDMVNHLPGFVEDDGDSVRGYSGAAGNVLIDGRRPASKSDSLSSLLGRINAADVDRIELIRGGAPGVDMQGRTVLANVIRKGGDSTTTAVSVGAHVFKDGRTLPNGTLTVTHRSGGRTYDFTLGRAASMDDSIGDGRYTIQSLGGPTTVVPLKYTAGGGGVVLGGGYKGPLLGGDLRLNTKLQELYFKTDEVFDPETATTDRIKDRTRDRDGELGLNYDRRVGPVDVEVVGLQRLHRAFFGEVETAPGTLAQFSGVRRTGETIGRLSGRYSPIKSLTLEAGAETAFNFLDGSTRFQLNGADVKLPSADVRVEENRTEAFGQVTWRPRASITVEAAVRFESSTISETGDVSLERSFFYAKPRFAISWSPNKDSQLRLRVEKKVGQLDFGNFISQTNLAQNQVNAGNPELRPDQRWQYEVAYERRFWGKGSVVVTLTHEQIDDVVDLVPIIGPGFAFDAPGNIGSGTNDTLDIQATLPLDRFGLKGGTIKSSSTWRNSEVTDPLTGETRRISSQRPKSVTLSYSQDVPRLKSTFGVNYDQVWTEVSYRLAEVDHRLITPPFLQVYGEYKPRPDLLFRLELTNLIPFVFKYQQDIYAGPRNTSALLEQREILIQSQPRIYVKVRKTF